MTYKNLTPLMDLCGVPIGMNDMAYACLIGRLNLFLQGDTGSGKTQLAEDAMSYFGSGSGDGKYAKEVKERYGKELGVNTNLAIDNLSKFPEDKTLFVLGRNDMDTRELSQRINLGKLNTKPTYNLEPLINPETGEVEYYYPRVNEEGIFVYNKLTKEETGVVRSRLEQLAGSTENLKEVTSKVNANLIVVDELPNCVPAVRAQLFNLFDGYVEIGGKNYPIGNGYSVGIATGNIGQRFTESSNELGRALKDRMHVIIDTDYFHPKPSDTFDILEGNTNPRVEFSSECEDKSNEIIELHNKIKSLPVPFEKLILANYLVHGLDYCSKGSKRRMKEAWPNELEVHEQGADVGLVLPVSMRAAKSILRLSQSLDEIVKSKGVSEEVIGDSYFDSMMQAYKFVSAYSGVLNDSAVNAVYSGDKYKALDAVIATTRTQFDSQNNNILAGIEMFRKGIVDQKVLNLFQGRWAFMGDIFENLSRRNNDTR